MLMSTSSLCCSCCSLSAAIHCLGGVSSQFGTDAAAGRVEGGVYGLVGASLGASVGGWVVPSTRCC